MMITYRVLLLVPEALTFEALTPDQQEAIRSVFGQYVMPMPGTMPAEGMKVVDAVTAPNFNQSNMAQHGLNWPILGMWTSLGDIVIPFDAAKFTTHLIPPENGPVVLHEPHRWAGWPELF